MKVSIVLYYFLSLVCVIMPNDNYAAGRPNRLNFSINCEDRKIMQPVQLNDSITAKLVFDSGAGMFILDSAFCANHPSIMSDILPDTLVNCRGSWSSTGPTTSVYKVAPKVNIVNSNMIYSSMMIFNMKKYYGNYDIDGVFNIPKNDTTNIWELNFENNYLEVHPSADFRMPENCFVAPIIKNDRNPYPFNVQLPIKIKCADGDTLTLNRTFMIDTGMPWDIALMYRAVELPFFNKKDDAVWTEDLGAYNRHYTVNATLFDVFAIDSLRIYTCDYHNGIGCNYLIGQNFLKRFNVFFDVKNMRIGFQPIRNFQRVVDPLYRRFHYSTYKNQQGKTIVKFVANNKGNYYRTAGLQKGDEIESVDGKPYKDISREERRNFYTKEKLVLDIIRKGKPVRIVVKVDKNEKQGD